ncbi:TolC family protein [Burkholderia sp. Ax-1719]|uniref:efflux transporter outer membrane subunit n=1 Tax=Burkholderia sp. Ax-1719 TaxID=2608334 RepID=UPI00141E3D34|nr:TolC family protein [Burkholderia sp. Ax-1719]NIE65389.1 TolC family protein [Burkholderia sp. Ax-1719]
MQVAPLFQSSPGSPAYRFSLRARGITAVSSALFAATLAACSVAEPYRSPVASAAQNAPFDAAASTPQVVSAAPPDHWWRLYQDPALDALIGEALAQNRDLAVAAARVTRARAVLAQADAARLPSTQSSFGVDYGKHQNDQIVAAARDTGSAPSRFGWAPGFALSWEIDFWGRVRNLVDAAHADAEAQQAATDALRVTVAAETAGAYARACAYAARLDVAQHSVAIAGRIATLTQKQQALGLVSTMELARAQAFADDTRASLPALDGEHRAALYELAVLLGRAPADIPRAAAECHQPPMLAQPFPVGDGAALLRRRPDLREAERRLAAAHARVGAAQAALYPSITFGGSINGLSTTGHPASLGDRYAIAWSVGPLVSWNFPNLAASRAQLDAAHADDAGARAAFDAQVLRALQETEQALARYGAAAREHDALATARAGHARAFALAEREFRAGAIDSLGMLDAERSLVADDAALAQSAQQIALDQVTVFKALGGGWQP